MLDVPGKPRWLEMMELAGASGSLLHLRRLTRAVGRAL